MAIKGKGKTKSRAAPRAPRPVPVKVRPPFFLRRWVQVMLSFLGGLGVFAVVVWAVIQSDNRNDDRKAAQNIEAASRIANQWQATVESALRGVGEVQPNQHPIVFTGLSTIVDEMAKGDTPEDAEQVASAAFDSAGAAIDAIDGVNLTDLIRDQGLNQVQTLYLLNSQERIVSGLQAYQEIATMAQTAATATPETAKALAERAQDLLPIADRVFQDGWLDYQQALISSGLAPTPPAGGIGG